MNFDGAINYLNDEIAQEGTRSETGQVLVAARDLVAQRDASLLDFEWAEGVGLDIYKATSDGLMGYGDTDYADDVQSTLCDILGIAYECEFE